MRVKNIAFSGFAAAILAAGAANAAPELPAIASKVYVDNQVSEVETTVTNLGDTVTNLGDSVTELQTTLEEKYTTTELLPGVITDNIRNIMADDSSDLKKALDNKQETLTDDQLAVLGSGITEDDVAQISTNASDIKDLQDGKADRVEGVTSANEGGIATVVAGGNYAMSDKKLSDLATTAALADKQDKLTDTQLGVLNSGVTGEKLAEMTEGLAGKQDKLTDTQLGVLGSGITGEKVAQITTNASDIKDLQDGKADKIKDIASDAIDGIATVDKDGQYQPSTVKLSNLATTSDLAGKADKSAVEALQTAISEENGLGKTVADLADTINNNETGLGAKQDKLTEDQMKVLGSGITGEKLEQITTDLSGKEDAKNKVADIETNKDSDVTFPTTKAVATYTATAIADAVSKGIDVNTNQIAAGAITTDKIAGKAVTSEKLADAVNEKINAAQTAGDVNKAISDAVTENDGVIRTNMIPRPHDGCKSESGSCLLSVDEEGNLTWIEITKPLVEGNN